MNSLSFRLIDFSRRQGYLHERNSISNLNVHYRMKYARITREIHEKMNSLFCRWNAFGETRRFIIEWYLDFDFLSSLDNFVSNPNS